MVYINYFSFNYSALLRLGCLDIQEGNLDEAKDRFQKAHNIDNSSITSRALLALVEKIPKTKRKILENILKECNSRDIYALCSLGNFHLQCARFERDKLRADTILRASEFYEKCLRIDGTCFSAAIGIGLRYLEQKKFSEAKDVLSQVWSLGKLQAGINLGHCFCEQGNYESATNVFDSCLTKFGKIPSVLFFAAQAYYVFGKSRKMPEHLEVAIRYMKEVCIVAIN